MSSSERISASAEAAKQLSASAGVRVMYFAYGSNMDPMQMAERCPGSEPIQAAKLPGYRLAFTWDAPSWDGGGVATVIPAAEGEVWGVLWLLTPEHIDILDEYECVAEGIYRREIVEVLVEGARREAFVYITNDATPKLPGRRYLDALVRGAEHFGLPADYIERLRTTPTS